MKKLLLLLALACPAYGQVASIVSTATGCDGTTAASPVKCTVAQMNTLLGTTTAVKSQTAVPVIMPSSGSIGNNGALTLTTALSVIYANAYMYFPANAISSGSAAQIDYVQMSSTTVGTIFNNVLSSGQPTIPGSPTAFVTTGPGAYTQTTTLISMLTIALAGNSLGANGQLYVDFHVVMPNNANTKTYSWKYGGTSMGFGTATTQSTQVPMYRMTNAGVTNIQVGTSGPLGSTAVARGAVDSTASQNITLNLQLGVATDYEVIEWYSIKLFPN